MGDILRGGYWRLGKEQLKKWLPSGYYYLFFGAFGSLFPFLNLYYRAVGMDPWQIGILGGIRPMIALLCAPLWCFLSNRYKIRKLILVASLLSWIGFTLPFAFLEHSTESEPCPKIPISNASEIVQFAASEEQREESTSELEEARINKDFTEIISHHRGNNSFDSEQIADPKQMNGDDWIGARNLSLLLHDLQQPIEDISRTLGEQSRRHRKYVEKLKDRRVFDSKEPFINAYSMPGMRLETVTGENAEPENRTPYDFKSRGFPYYNKRKNPYSDAIYAELFYIVLIGEVVQSPTDDFNTHFDSTFLEPLGVLYQNVRNNNLYSSIGIGLFALVTGVTLRYAPKIQICKEEYSDYRIAFGIFTVLMALALVISTKFNFTYRRRRRSFEVKQSVQNLLSIDHLLFVVIVLIMGMLRGVLFNFVYWNIADLGGSDLVVGITVVSQYLSDTVMNLSSPILMSYLGYIGMVYLALASYALRFLVYSWLSTPKSVWVTPPIELLQGVSNATAWSAFLLYITNYTPSFTFPTGLFFLQGLYLGVGAAVGTIIGGILIQSFGPNVAFRLFGLFSVLTCLLFLMIQSSGASESPPFEADTVSFLADEDDYSSYSDDELFDTSRRGIAYIPSKDTGEGKLLVKKMVLPTYSSPLVSICMSFNAANPPAK